MSATLEKLNDKLEAIHSEFKEKIEISLTQAPLMLSEGIKSREKNIQMENTLLNRYKSSTLEQALRRAVALEGSNLAPTLTEEQRYYLLKNSKIDAPDENPKSLKTALHIAIEKEKIGWVEALINQGAHYNILDAKQKTAVCYAAASKNSTIRAIVFKELAVGTMQKVTQNFKIILNGEERNKILFSKEVDIIFKKASEFIQALNEELQLLAGFTFYSWISKQGKQIGSLTPESKEKHVYALHKCFEYIKFLLNIGAGKACQDTHPLPVGICGSTTQFFLLELLREFPSARSGELPLYQAGAYPKEQAFIKREQAMLKQFGIELSEHTFLLIDGEPDKVSATTVLCNPLKAEIFYTVGDINKYLKEGISGGVATNFYKMGSNYSHSIDNIQLMKNQIGAFVSDLIGVLTMKSPDNKYEGNLEAFMLQVAQDCYINASEQEKVHTFNLMKGYKSFSDSKNQAYLEKKLKVLSVQTTQKFKSRHL